MQPDLPMRIKKSIPFTHYKRETFYAPKTPVGYNDYPFADEEAETNYHHPHHWTNMLEDKDND